MLIPSCRRSGEEGAQRTARRAETGRVLLCPAAVRLSGAASGWFPSRVGQRDRQREG